MVERAAVGADGGSVRDDIPIVHAAHDAAVEAVQGARGRGFRIVHGETMKRPSLVGTTKLTWPGASQLLRSPPVSSQRCRRRPLMSTNQT
jgi:hypothetical protein